MFSFRRFFYKKEDEIPSELWRAALKTISDARGILPIRRLPKIVWRNYRTTAGRVYYDEHVICLSKLLLTTPERVRETVYHEYAHLYVYEVWGDAAKPHGVEWRWAMLQLGQKPVATHNYPCKKSYSKKKLLYACEQCFEEIPRVRPLLQGRVYYHVGCGGRIVRAPARRKKTENRNRRRNGRNRPPRSR